MRARGTVTLAVCRSNVMCTWSCTSYNSEGGSRKADSRLHLLPSLTHTFPNVPSTVCQGLFCLFSCWDSTFQAWRGSPNNDISLASSQGSPPFSQAASNCHSELKCRLLWNFWLLPFRSGNIVKSETGCSVQLKFPRCLELKADSSSRDSEKMGRSLAQAENHVCASRYCLPVCNGLSAYWLPWEIVNQ